MGQAPSVCAVQLLNLLLFSKHRSHGLGGPLVAVYSSASCTHTGRPPPWPDAPCPPLPPASAPHQSLPSRPATWLLTWRGLPAWPPWQRACACGRAWSRQGSGISWAPQLQKQPDAACCLPRCRDTGCALALRLARLRPEQPALAEPMGSAPSPPSWASHPVPNASTCLPRSPAGHCRHDLRPGQQGGVCPAGPGARHPLCEPPRPPCLLFRKSKLEAVTHPASSFDLSILVRAPQLLPHPAQVLALDSAAPALQPLSPNPPHLLQPTPTPPHRPWAL